MARDTGLDVRFPTTRASVVLGAANDDVAVRRRSWQALVAAYWKPAYKHVRIRWHASREDAQDAIQGFFEQAMEKDYFAAFEPARGRFRTFLRVCLDRFVSNQAKARTSDKRGGGVAVLDFDAAEAEIARAGAAAWQSPEECFDREWRRELVARAVGALRARCEAEGRRACFTAFERYDLAEPPERPTYQALAQALGVPETAVTNHLAWARRELRKLVLAGLEPITASTDELDAELRLVLGAGGS